MAGGFPRPRTPGAWTTAQPLLLSPYYLRIDADGPKFEPLVPPSDATLVLVCPGHGPTAWVGCLPCEVLLRVPWDTSQDVQTTWPAISSFPNGFIFMLFLRYFFVNIEKLVFRCSGLLMFVLCLSSFLFVSLPSLGLCSLLWILVAY